MPVAMVIGVNERLPWCSLLGILWRAYFDFVAACICVLSELVGTGSRMCVLNYE